MVDNMSTYCQQRIGALYHVKDFLGPRDFSVAYRSFVRPVCEYGSVAIMGASATHLSKLESIQKMAERFSRCKFPSLHSRHEVSSVGLLHKLLDKRGRGPPQHFYPAITTTPPTHSYSLQSLSCDPLLYLHWFNMHPWIYFEGASLEVQLQTFGHLLL